MIDSTIGSVCETLKAIGVPDRDIAVYSTVTMKNTTSNMKFRRMCLELGYESRENAHQLWILCARDPLFFLNTFAYLLEAREAQDWNTNVRYGTNKIIPFITRTYQDTLITSILKHLGRSDIAVPKSRETGISWIMVALAAWDWIFHDQSHIGFVSKDLPSANNPNDPDALFSKFEFLVDHLPYWILDEHDWERNIQKNTMKNLKNGSSLSAYAATGDTARGGRKTWLLMDEFHFFKAGEDDAAMDSSVHVTPCRIFVSTANRDRGMAGAFYKVVSEAATKNGVVIVVDWKDDAEKRRGLYHSDQVEGTDTYRLVIDDMEFWLDYCNHDSVHSFRHPSKPGEAYPFILDGRYRSLYYDHVWNRPGSTPQSVAAELDRNFGGATAQIFDPMLLQRTISAAKPVTITGDLMRNPAKPDEWMFQALAAGGNVSLWCPLEKGHPPKGEYVFGSDIGAGTGGEWSSYSALEGINKKTGEQAFEWRSNTLDPMQFGELTVWVLKWFYGAYLVPEVNGPLGQLYINKVVRDLKYGNVYRQVKAKVAYRESTERIGYVNNDRGIELLKHMETAIRKKRVHLHSLLALNECSRYFMKNGRLVHSAAEATDDGAGKGLAHGDAAIALGCASFGVDDVPLKQEIEETTAAPYGSFAWRKQQYEERQRHRTNKSYWDEG